MRPGLLSSLLLLLVGGQPWLKQWAWAQRVAELRTGIIELRTWPDVTAAAAAAAWGPGGGRGGQASTRSAAVSGGGDDGAAGLDSGAAEEAGGAYGLFLVAYTSGPQQLHLRRSLTSRGARLLAHLRPHTWVVAMTAEAAEQVAVESGAAMAPLGPPHRIDPEWQPLLREVEAVAAEAEAEAGMVAAQRRRRQLLGGGSDAGGEVAGEVEDDTELVAAVAVEVGRRAARALSQLQPLARPGGPGALGSERRRRQAAEQQPTGQGPGQGQGQEEAGSGLGSGPAAPPLPMYGVLVTLLPVPQLTAAAVGDLAADLPAALAAQLGLTQGQQGAGAGGALPPCWPLVEAPQRPRGSGGGSGPPLLQVHVCAQHLPAAVAWLSGLWQAQWLEPQWAPQLHNAVANIIAQTGGLLSLSQYTAPLAVRKPYWDAGLDGTGEVVGVTDTGVDMTSCYFYDSQYGPALAALAANSTPGPFTLPMPAARKVVAYSVVQGAAYGDPGSGAHGTHTSGTVAGAVPAGGPGGPSGLGSGYRLDNATGAVPGARLSVIDISTAGGGLTVPSPMDQTLLQVHASAGVSITSDSWGVLSRDYTAAANDFDRYLWSHGDHVALVAAGNYGQSPGLRSGQVTHPAAAKNVIAVGSCLHSPPFTFYYPFYTVRGRRLGSGQAWSQQVWPIECRDVGSRDFLTGVGGPSRNATLELVAVSGWSLQPRPPPDPATGTLAQQQGEDGGGELPAPGPSPAPAGPAAFSSSCSLPPSLVASGALAGAVAVAAASPNCSLEEQVLALQRAGAAAVLLGYTEPSNPPTPVLVSSPSTALNSTGVTIPVAYITQSLCSWLLGNMSASSRPVTFSVSLSATQGINSVASFSSAGPALDGRVKPDLVAPGFQLTSAWKTGAGAGAGTTQGDTCGVSVAARSGTSMSTPTAAGHTALVRQYLRTGFYPTGSPADAAAAPFTPSGMLLKAMVIAGAKSLEGGLAFGQGSPMGPPPDAYQGWGRLSLPDTLPLPGLTPAGFSLQVADRGQFTASGQQAALTGIKATGKGPISIVLTWCDYPADLNAPTQLVNDLDLVVRLELPAATATAAAATAATTANASPSPDRLNTVEHVYITHPSPGAALTITVTAHSLPSRLLSGPDALLPQRWAVAVVGHFSGTLASELNPAYVCQGQLGTRDTSGGGGGPAAPSPTPPPAAAHVSSSNSTAAASVNTTSTVTGEGTSDSGTSSNRTAAPKQQQPSPAHKPSPPAAASSGGKGRRRTSASPTSSSVWSAGGGGGKEGIPWAWGLRGGGHTSAGLQRRWPQLRERMWLLLPDGRVSRSAVASGMEARNAAALVVEDKEDMERSFKGT